MKYVRNEYVTDVERFSERFVSSLCASANSVEPSLYL